MLDPLTPSRRVTKKSIKEKAQDMLYGRKPLEHVFLMKLLANHAQAEEKVGCGVARFYLGRSPHEQYDQPCFWFERTDGSLGYFSYLAALRGTSSSKYEDFVKALRASVFNQTKAFERASSATHCAISGDTLTGREVHVDHVIPFSFLVKEFLRLTCIDVSKLNIIVAHGFPYWIEDEETRLLWQDFHQEQAQLQLVTAEANMSKGAR
jgi:Protein of unknown function (DUF3223)